MRKQHIVFGLKDELSLNTPEIWGTIHKKIAYSIVSELLSELEGIPSPEGRLFGEIRDAVIQIIHKRGA